MTPIKLNLGCGPHKLPGYLNVDKLEVLRPDMVMDMERYPWPFAENSVAEIYSHHVFEHIDDLLALMRECYRVLEPGGLLDVTVPYGVTFAHLSEPTHRHAWTEVTVGCFLPGHPANIYGFPGFVLESLELTSDGPYGTPAGAWKPRLRNLLPFRRFLKFFWLGMYDQMRFRMRKPMVGEKVSYGYPLPMRTP